MPGFKQDLMTDLSTTETAYRWSDMETQDQKFVLEVHADILQATDLSVLARVFNLGNPKIVMANDREYCFIHNDSFEAMELLIKNYL